MSWYQNNHKYNGGSNWGGQYAGPGQSKWWVCPVQECRDSLSKLGRKPWSNKPSDYKCGHCAAAWVHQPSQQDAKLAGAREALRIKLAEKAKLLCSGTDADGFQLSNTQQK